ncbi:hypothetical protein [Hwangdonia sp.]|uniref:helix-hairpin-helix domain-containing protein n=1 Tax=Hwangdonia sp. TaxID=1883432 RepID=UPI003AB28B13
MCGATIQVPCIITSQFENIIECATIYLGYGYLISLESLTIIRFLTDRNFNGTYASSDDFIDRVTISIEQLTILIRIDAFGFTSRSKTELLWEAIFKLNVNKQETTQARLFKTNHRKFQLPSLSTTNVEDAYDQIELLGFPLCGYFQLVDNGLNDGIKANDLNKYKNKNALLNDVLVNTRFHKTSHGKRIRFCTFVDQDGHCFETVHFTKVVDKYPINGMGVYTCYGKVKEEFDFCSLDIIWTNKMSLTPDPRG